MAYEFLADDIVSKLIERGAFGELREYIEALKQLIELLEELEKDLRVQAVRIDSKLNEIRGVLLTLERGRYRSFDR